VIFYQRKILTKNFSFYKFKNKIPIIGDGIYSNSNELIDLTLKKDLHKKIKFKERLLAKEIYESYKDTIFKKRFNIEGHFENLKNKFN